MTKRKLPPEEAAEVAKAQLCISNIIVHHLPKNGLASWDDRFFVQIEVDDKISSVTKTQRGHSLRWENEYRCGYQKGSRIQLKVFARHRIHHDQFIGVIRDDVESLLRQGFIRRQISDTDEIGTRQLPASMEFQVASLTPTTSDGSKPDDGKPNIMDGKGVACAVASTTITMEVSAIVLTHLPKIEMVAFNNQFFVLLVVEDIAETQATSSKTEKNGSIYWNEKYIFHVPETASLSLQVYARRHLHSDEYIGMVSGRIGAFLQSSGCCDGQLVVFDKHNQKNLETKLSFRMMRSSSSHGNEHGGGPSSRQSKDYSPQHHVDDTVRAVSAMASLTRKGGVQVDAEPLYAQVVSVDATTDVFQLLLTRITTFVKMARAFGEAHPYTKMALMVLTAGHEVIQQQLSRDDSIRRLASIMCESYGLLSNAPDLSSFDAQAEIINLLARQTIECAYFVRDYAIHKSGLKRGITNMFSNIDATIQGYETVFRQIRTALEQQVVINTQLVVFRIHDTLKDLTIKVDLNTLPYATGASYHAQRIYDMPLEETHVAEISDWVNGKSSEAIYLLIGPRGSETSAIAHAVARQFDNISRLGSSYCLDRTRQGQKKPANLFSTIARDLADHDPEFMACLRDMTKRRAIASSPHIPTQFNFILTPAQQLTSFGPVLVVIDALDACGDVNSRAEVVSVLKEKTRFLPPSFKFLITCLSETDVAIALRDEPHVLAKELDAAVTGQLRDNGFTTGRTKPRPLTPPIQTELSLSDYFSPSYTDAGSSKGFVAFKHVETREKSISFDQADFQTVTHTSLKQTVKQHATLTPRRVLSCTPILDEPNARLFTSDPTAPTEGTFEVLVSRITAFVNIGDAFAEACSYTRMALVVLTAGHEVIQQQFARDDSIRRLASIMCESYGLLPNAPDLSSFHSQAETVNLLARQTIECAYFIRDYAIHKSGWKHSISNVLPDIDAIIQAYETAFRNIKTALEQKVAINTQSVLFRIKDALKDTATNVDLGTLPYATRASYHAQRRCGIPLDGNHVTEILDWVNGKSNQGIYLLIGLHEPEISAVAHAVARQFDIIYRLGSSYCLDRTRQGQKKPANLFSTIARDLADHDPEFMAFLGDMTKRRATASSPHISTQFNFILAPAQQLTSFGPVLVVIDALDACGDVNSRTEVVSVLKEKAQFLPPSFKFLITCLPETDVAIALRDEPHVLAKELDAVVIHSSLSETDIRKAIDAQLENAPLRLLNTSTGRLYNREAQINAFLESTEYKEILTSSMTPAPLHTKSIREVVAKYFSWVMLSHRWESKEMLLQDVQNKVIYELDPVGTTVKLQKFCEVARDKGYHWAWSDTCCIDQSNSAEVQRSVNSMFVWYRQSALTIVYLSDVPPWSTSRTLANSAWNMRGWTVQEFLAPRIVLFYDAKWIPYRYDHSTNHKESVTIMRELQDSTGIDALSLVNFRPGMTGARQKLQWVSSRITTVQEDIAYSLFGIFKIHLPVIYGEGKENALGRLLQEIIAQSGDIIILDWVGKSSEFNSCLPADIASYDLPPCTLPLPSEYKIQSSVSSLRNHDAAVMKLASTLYVQLSSMGAPRFANRRLHLHCVTFPVTAVKRRRSEDRETCPTYEVKADGLQDMLITTDHKLVQFWRARTTRQTFLLVRPWNRFDLELPDLEDDVQSVDDRSESESESPSDESHSGSSGEDEPLDSGSSERRLRLIVRLGQPFGALLLAQQRSGEYKRIASDNKIIAQVKDMAGVCDMMDVRTLEIV